MTVTEEQKLTQQSKNILEVVQEIYDGREASYDQTKDFFNHLKEQLAKWKTGQEINFETVQKLTNTYLAQRKIILNAQRLDNVFLPFFLENPSEHIRFWAASIIINDDSSHNDRNRRTDVEPQLFALHYLTECLYDPHVNLTFLAEIVQLLLGHCDLLPHPAVPELYIEKKFYSSLYNAGKINSDRFVPLVETLLTKWFSEVNNDIKTLNPRFSKEFVDAIRMLGEWQESSSLNILSEVLYYPGNNDFCHLVHIESYQAIRLISENYSRNMPELNSDKLCWCVKQTVIANEKFN